MTENLQSCITRLKVYFHVLLTHETSCSLTTGWLASSNVFASDWSPHHLCSSSKQQKDAHSVCKSFRNSGQRCWPETCLCFAIQSGPVTKVVSAMGPRTPDELGGTISRSLYTTLVYWRMNKTRESCFAAVRANSYEVLEQAGGCPSLSLFHIRLTLIVLSCITGMTWSGSQPETIRAST